jgi:hypothetical protein
MAAASDVIEVPAPSIKQCMEDTGTLLIPSFLLTTTELPLTDIRACSTKRNGSLSEINVLNGIFKQLTPFY